MKRLVAIATLLLFPSWAVAQPSTAADSSEPSFSLEIPEGRQITLLLDNPAPFSGLLMDEERAAWYAALRVGYDESFTELTLSRQLVSEQSATIDAMQVELNKLRKPIRNPGTMFTIGAISGISLTVIVVVVVAQSLGAK